MSKPMPKACVVLAIVLSACRDEYPVGEAGDGGAVPDAVQPDAVQANPAQCWARGPHQAGKSSPNLPCCPGLVKTATLYWSAATMRCEDQFPAVAYTCRLPGECGNDACEADAYENLCTCPQDCRTPGEGAQSTAVREVPDAGAPAACPNESVILGPVPGRYGASAIALDRGHVYLKTRTGVVRVAKSGGAFTAAADPVPTFARNDRAMDATHVYYLQGSNLMRSLHDGSSPEVLLERVESECFAVAVTADDLYWTNTHGLLYKAAKEPRLSFPLVIGYGGASDCDDDYDGIVLAVDETSAYWTAGPIRSRVSDGDPLLLMKTCK